MDCPVTDLELGKGASGDAARSAFHRKALRRRTSSTPHGARERRMLLSAAALKPFWTQGTNPVAEKTKGAVGSAEIRER